MSKRILITGGASGIGLAIAEKFLAEGYEIALCDADSAAIAALLDTKNAKQDKVFARQADVTSEPQMQVFLSELEARWSGRVDVVCANAGTGGPAGLLDEISYQEWQDCLAVNLNGSFLTCRWAARLMRTQGSGLITLTSSTAGLFGYPLRGPYAAAKWGIIGLAKTLAGELGEAGVRVNAICPGSVEGPRMDRVVANEARARGVPEQEIRDSYVQGVSMKTWVQAEDIANSIYFLASPAGAKISGQALAIDGNTETLSA